MTSDNDGRRPGYNPIPDKPQVRQPPTPTAPLSLAQQRRLDIAELEAEDALGVTHDTHLLALRFGGGVKVAVTAVEAVIALASDCKRLAVFERIIRLGLTREPVFFGRYWCLVKLQNGDERGALGQFYQGRWHYLEYSEAVTLIRYWPLPSEPYYHNLIKAIVDEMMAAPVLDAVKL